MRAHRVGYDLRMRTAISHEQSRGPAFIADLDPDILESVPPARRALAARDLRAMVSRVGRGTWQPRELAPEATVGLLILDGIAFRRIEVGGRCAGDLVGAGDLLRPWESDVDFTILRADAEWQVLQPLTVALIDESFVARAARWPGVVSCLLGRAVGRTRMVTLQFALAQRVRSEERLLLVLWELAQRWGKVTPDGVMLPIALRHHHLATLVASLRPSVTLGLQRLAARGLVQRRTDGYLLRGEPRDAWAELSRAHERGRTPVAAG
jgi:CRP/FNR family cyclic AMP-dependent transcriptional regulator